MTGTHPVSVAHSRKVSSLLVVLSLLTSAASAHAECAWVLWITSAPPGSVSSTPAVLSSYGSMAECVKEIDNYDIGTKRAQRIPGRYSPTRLVIPYDAQREEERGYREFLCLPDTVDPRGATNR